MLDPQQLLIRDVRPSDAEGIVRVFNPIIEHRRLSPARGVEGRPARP
jgi:hypothetical protein